MADIVLDPGIRDWVLVPIVILMFMVGMLRNAVSMLLKGAPKIDLKENITKQAMMRCDRIKRNANSIPEQSFMMRKEYLADKEKGQLIKMSEDAGEAANPMQDPSMMMEMMKGNLTMVVSQMGTMGIINTFFEGFIAVKLPFPLSYRFKSMLQKGVHSNSLDVSYVSSISWYFLNLFGLRGIFSLVLGENNETDDTKMMQSQMSGGGMGGPGQDPGAVLKKAAESLDLVDHKWRVATAESDLIDSMGDASTMSASDAKARKMLLKQD